MIRSFPPHPNPLPQGRGKAIHPPAELRGILALFDKGFKDSRGEAVIIILSFLEEREHYEL
ncbi:MAG: hypothetical protein ABID54_04255 [Pseudomonadota bacterium]